MRSSIVTLPIFVLSILLNALPASACPKSLEKIRTVNLGGASVCEIADRYSAAKKKLERAGIDANRIADVIAPRFIQPSHWLKVREKNNFSPWTVYEPAPLTWKMWEVARLPVDAGAADNLKAAAPAKISIEWLLSIHETGMKNLVDGAGTFREFQAVGMALKYSTAAPVSGLQYFVKFGGYRITPKGEPLVTWSPRRCLEDLSKEFLGSHSIDEPMEIADLPEMLKATSFRDGTGVARQCGYFTYPAEDKILPLLKKWESDINSRFAKSFLGTADVMKVTARAQKWFVAVHPFADGNGRMSRFIMDYLLQSIGLPTPILTDMDNDLISSESEWAKVIGNGVLKTLNIVENCAAKPSTPGCNAVSTSP